MNQSGIFAGGRGLSLLTTLSALTLLAACSGGSDFRGQAEPPPEPREFISTPSIAENARRHAEFCAQGNNEGFPCDDSGFPLEFCAQGNRGGYACNGTDFHLGRIGAHHAYGWSVQGDGNPVIYPEGGVRIGVGGTGLLHGYPKIRDNLALSENANPGNAAFRGLMEGLTAQYHEFDADFSNRSAPGACGAVTTGTGTDGNGSGPSFDNCFPRMSDVHADHIVHIDDLVLFDPDESWSGGIPAGVGFEDGEVPVGVSASGGTRYEEGDLVIYEGRIYAATRTHLSVFVPNASEENGENFTVNVPVSREDMASSQPDLRNELAPWREVFLFSYVDEHCTDLRNYEEGAPGLLGSDCRAPADNGEEKKFFVDFGDGTPTGRDLRVVPDASGLLAGSQSAGIIANERNLGLIRYRTRPRPEYPFHGVAFAAQIVPHVASRALDAECTMAESNIANPMYAFPGDPVTGAEEFSPCLRAHAPDTPVPNYSFSDTDTVDDYLSAPEKEELAARLGLEVSELDKIVDPTYDFVPADFQNDMTRFMKCEQGQNTNFFSLGCLVELSDFEKSYLAPLFGLPPTTADDRNFLERSSGELTVAERARFLTMADPDETRAGDIYFRRGGPTTTPVVYYDKDRWLADYISSIPGVPSDPTDDAVDVFLLDVAWEGNGVIPNDPDCTYSYPRPRACDDGDDATVVTQEDEYRIHRDFLEANISDTLVAMRDFFSRRDKPLMVVRSGYQGFDADPFRTLRAAVIQRLDPDVGPNLDPGDIDPTVERVFCYDGPTGTYSHPDDRDCGEGTRKLTVSGYDAKTEDRDDLVITIEDTRTVPALNDGGDCATEDAALDLPGCQTLVTSTIDITEANDRNSLHYRDALAYAPDRRGTPRTLAALPYYHQVGCNPEDANCLDFRGSMLTAVALDSDFYTRVVDNVTGDETWFRNIDEDTQIRDGTVDNGIYRKLDGGLAVKDCMPDDDDRTDCPDGDSMVGTFADAPGIDLLHDDGTVAENLLPPDVCHASTELCLVRDRVGDFFVLTDDTDDSFTYMRIESDETYFVRNRNGDYFVLDGIGDTVNLQQIVPTDPRHPDNFAPVNPVNRNQLLDDGSPRCGPLPDDWHGQRDGRHFCLAAPGAETRVNDGWGGAYYRYAQEDLIGSGDDADMRVATAIPKPGSVPVAGELPFADRGICEEGLSETAVGQECVLGDVYHLYDGGSYVDISDYSPAQRKAIKKVIDSIYPDPAADSAANPNMKLRDALKADVDDGRLDTGFQDRTGCDTLLGKLGSNPDAECIKNPRLIAASRIPASEKDYQPDLYAASYLAGSLALLDERFRGQLSGRELGLRLVNTANNREAFGKLPSGAVEADSVWYKIYTRHGFACDGDGADGFMDTGNVDNRDRCTSLRVAAAEALGVTDDLLAIASELEIALPSWDVFFDVMNLDSDPGAPDAALNIDQEQWMELWECYKRNSAVCTDEDAVTIADRGSPEAFASSLRRTVAALVDQEVSREILETYGAGLIDLDAAMNCLTGEERCVPKDLSLRASAGGGDSPSYREFRFESSSFFVDVPIGDGLRNSLRGREIALFDDADAPFWYPLTSMISTGSNRQSLAERRYRLTADGHHLLPLKGGGMLHWSAISTDGIFSDSRGTQRWASRYNSLELDEDYQLRFSLRQPVGAPGAETELLVALGEATDLSFGIPAAGSASLEDRVHPYLGFAGEGIGIGASLRLGPGRLTSLGFSSEEGLVGGMLAHSDDVREAHGGLLEYGFYPAEDMQIGLQAGALVEEDRALGLRTQGGFGDMGASTTAFAGISLDSTLPGIRTENWRLRARAFGGMTRPSVPSAGLIEDWSTLMSSSFRIGLAGSNVLLEDDKLSLFLEQPLRVESGLVALVVPIGRTREGAVLHRRVDGALQPSGRELELSSRYEFSLDENTALTFGAGMVYEGGHSVSQDTEFYGLGDLTFRF